MVIKAVITTLDNLSVLKEQIPILRDEPIDEIVVVSNGSQDGTNEWLDKQHGLTVVKRDNRGAGPGRNAGLDAAGDFDYVLMLDGGIRPLRGGTQHMFDYLEIHRDADVIGVEIPDFRTDIATAWRRWPSPILDTSTYHNSRLSHTAYGMVRFRAFDGLRFSEEGPFGQPGWGADDDEMCYRWNEAGIVVHVVTCKCRHGKPCNGVHPYRHGSGSFRRLYQETGIWPNQYGSNYEQRLVFLQQEWPQYQPGVVWGEPWLTVVIKASSVRQTAMMVRAAHERLRLRRFDKPYDHAWNPYSVVVDVNGAGDAVLRWAEAFRLRQHHGDTTIIDDKIVRRNGDAQYWTGDFRLSTGEDWRHAIRPGSGYYGMVSDMGELETLLNKYEELYPRQGKNLPPDEKRREIT